MSRISHKNLLKNKAVYTRLYQDMGGVNLNDTCKADEKTLRFAYCENMYRDYESGSGEVIESIPGYRQIAYLGQRINGIHIQPVPSDRDYAVIHSGEYLYRFPIEDRDKASETVGEGTLSFSDCKSRSACISGTLYITDGSSITRVTPEGRVARVLDSSSASPYVPTTYLNGEEYEQKNLLTDKFIEKFTLSSWQAYSYGTPGLLFAVTDEEEGTCCVSGCDSNVSGNIFIPTYADIGGKRYRVTSIASHAFYSNMEITSVRCADGLIEVGSNAFFGCAALVAVYLSPSLERLCYRAFAGCQSLIEINIGNSIKYIGANVFSSSGVSGIYFGGTKDEFAKAESQLDEEIQIYYETFYKEGCLEFPVKTGAAYIEGLFMNGKEQTVVTRVTDENGVITSLILSLANAASANGAEIEIRGKLSNSAKSHDRRAHDFLSTDYAKINGGKRAIIYCTEIHYYDGKLFMSGNPELPGTVFYSAKTKSGAEEPLYFGSLNFFTDGGDRVRGLCTLSGELAVLSSDKIYCHKPESGALDKCYPVTTVTGGVTVLGEPICFGTDTVFLGNDGIHSLSKANAAGERRIECRSHNIAPSIALEDKSDINLCVWRGYLVVCSHGKMYLADSRAVFEHSSGCKSYEWYYLNGIGRRSGAIRVYRYSSEQLPGYAVWHFPDTVTDKTVLSEITEAQGTVYYVEDNGIKYRVYPTEEKTGGVFHPATVAAATGEVLFFGSDDGGLFVFNNDKRGVAPDRIKASADFDAEDYSKKMGKRIHPDFYSFDQHAPTYAISTFDDDLDIPYLRKNTVPGTLTVRCKGFDRSSFTVETVTDRTGCKTLVNMPSGKQSFTDFDFSSFVSQTDDYFTVAIPEAEKRWITKSVRIYSREYCAPIGVHSISYSFTPQGKI